MLGERRYGTGAIALHWLLALAIAGQLGLGFAMPPGPAGFALFQLHKSIGILILALTVARIAWRLARRPPPPLETGWQSRLAGAVHFALYAFMLLGPLTGWALVSTSEVKVPTLLFGVVPLPHLPLPADWAEAAEETHEILAFIGIALIGLHVAGALRHHLLLRDGTLARMAPRGSAVIALTLLVAAVGLFALPFALPPATSPEPERTTASPAPPRELLVEIIEAGEEIAPAEPEVEEEVPAEVAGPPPAWTISPGGSLRFTVGNGADTISGRFSRWDGTIVFDPENPESADLRVNIDLASASVGDATQDSMLQGAEFFDTGSASRATWRSTEVRRTGNGYEARGTLTLRGRSRPVPLRFNLSGEGNRRQATGSASIDRSAFGIGQGENGATLAPQVNVEFSFTATKQ